MAYESYFPLRARNPYLTGISPTFDQPMSPAVAAPQPLEVIESSPPRRAVAPPSYVDPIETARTAYAAGAPTTTKGRILQALVGAGLGFLQGASRDRENPIAAGIGGAATGGAISAISPKTGRAMQFEMIERPGIEDRLRREEAMRQRARQATADELKTRETEADIELKRANAAKARTPATPRAVSPVSVAPGSTLVDPTTGRQIFSAPPRESAPKLVTFQGQTFDYNDPADRERLEAAQAKLPRDKFGRFITRGDERATVRANAPRQAKPKEDVPTIPLSKVREIAEQEGVSVDVVKARLVARRIKVIQ